MTAPRWARVTAGTATRSYPEEAARAQLVVVGEAVTAHRRRTRLLTVGAVVAVVVGLFAIVSLHVLLSQGQVALDRLEAQAEDLANQNQRLRVEVAELESPNRVVVEARRKLGMAPPTSIVSLNAPPSTASPGPERPHRSGEQGPERPHRSGEQGPERPHQSGEHRPE